ncbi:MAG: LysR substrate-binding domain-containing protein [SAR86 cluster bacterium]|jgi:LysR family transcriptional regulator, hydrogen peroxide-inducible genes activator|nr:LysR substrate-binding domain-containing protein [SAR86 cluster bacterium]
MISLKQIHYALAVSRTMHFKKAANDCFVSPSTLSNSITEMEKKLGIEVFERDNKKVLVTKIGKKFLDKAQAIKLGIEDIEKLGILEKGPLTGSLSIGIIPTIGPYLLPLVLPSLKSQYPKLKLTIVEGQSKVLIDKIKQGEIDTAILALPFDTEGLLALEFWQEDFYWITSSDDVQAGKNEISASELEESKLMLLEEGHCLKDQALDACKFPIDSLLNISASSLTTLIQLVAGKMGTTLVPQMALEQLFNSNPLLAKVHLDEPGPHRKLALIFRSTYPVINDILLIKELLKFKLEDHFN